MLTYFDVVEHLITASFGGPQDAEQRDIRSAVLRAYDEVTTMRDWAYYVAHSRLITTAPYSTGTVTYDDSVGELTLTGGAWPSWAPGAHLQIGDRVSIVESVSGATATLDAAVRFLPSMDGQSGLSYTLCRVNYPLPSDFRNMDEPTDEYNWWSGVYVEPGVAMKMERVANASGKPLHWTIIKDRNGSGWQIQLIGYPTSEETVDFMYRRSARPLKYSGHESVSRDGHVTRVGNAITGHQTTFASDVVGSLLRIGNTSLRPGPQWSLNPPTEESEIIARSSDTSISSAASGSIPNNTKYIITDPIDVPPHMHNVVLSCAEYWLARMRNKTAEKEFALYQRDLRLAMERDQLAPISGRSREVYHNGGWRSPLLADGGT